MSVWSVDARRTTRGWLASLTLVMSLVSGLSGCVTGSKFSGFEQTPSDKADIYVYRDAAFFASMQDFEIAVDGRKVGNLSNGSYLKIRIGPGAHMVRASTGTGFGMWNKNVRVWTQEGKRSFVLVTVGLKTANEWSFDVGQRSEEDAAKVLPNPSASNTAGER